MKKILFVILLLVSGIGYAADVKITQLTEDTAPTTDDLTVTVNNPGGTPASRKVTLANLSKGINASNIATGQLPVSYGGTGASTASGARTNLGAGDASGPSSSTDNALARFDSTTGKLLQNSGAILDDSNNLTGVTTLNTGQGAYELYAMDQNVLTSSTPSFAGVTLTDRLSHSQTVNTNSIPGASFTVTPSTLLDGSSYTGTDTTMSTTYIAVKFTASSSDTMGDFQVRLKESGTFSNPYDSLSGYIYSDDGGSPSKPSTLLTSANGRMDYHALTTSYALYSFWASRSLVSGTTYWLVIKQSVAPSGASIVFDSTAGTDYGATSSDGSTWTNTNNRLYHVIRARNYYGIYSSSQNNVAGYFAAENNYGIYASSDSFYGAYIESISNDGMQVHSYSGHGIKSTSENSNGLYGYSNGSTGVRGESTVSYGVSGISNLSTTNQPISPMANLAQSTGTVANGFGGGIEYRTENASGSVKTTMFTGGVFSDATNGSEDYDFIIQLMAGGSAKAEKMRMASDGLLTVGAAGTDGSLKLYSEQGATDYFTLFQPGTQTQDVTYTLPVDDGSASQVLTTDGSGALSWASPSSGAAGSDTQIQFNDGGSTLGGDAGLVYSKTTDSVTVENLITTQGLTINGIATPSAPSAVDAAVAGNPNGTYTYKVSYCTNTSCSDQTETVASSASGSVSVTNSQITVTIPTSTDPQVAARRIYRTQAGGSTHTALAIVTNNSATTYTDNIADATIASNAREKEADETAIIKNRAGDQVFMESDETLFLGRRAGQDLTSGNKNTGVGSFALLDVTSGSNNTAVGYRSLFALTTGTHNTCFGTETCDAVTTGTRNACVGFGACGGLTTAEYNLVAGIDAAASLDDSSNVLLGYHSGFALTTGSDNVFIGTNSGDAPTSATDVILIGDDSDVATGRSNAGCIGSGCSPGEDNAFVLGGAVAYEVGIGDSTPDHTLDVAGNIGMSTSGYLNFGDTTGTSGYGIRDNAGTIECKNSGGSWSACQDGGGAGGGDNITVNTTAATDANLKDSTTISFALDTGTTPDDVTASIVSGSVSATHLGTDSVSADELNATGVEAELEAVLDLADLQGAVTDAQVPDTVTASNYLALSGGTMTGQIVSDNLGVEFDESDTNPTCAAGNFNIYADLSENKLKMCQNGSASDLGGSGSGDITAVGPGCSTGACFTDTVTTTGSDLIVWEGSTSDANEFTISVPSDPAADKTATFQAVTGTLPVVIDRDVSNASLVNDTTETTMYTYTVPANTLGTNGMIRISYVGELLNNTGGSATLVVRVKLGSTTVFDSNTILAATNSSSERSLFGHCWIAAANATNAQVSGGQISLGATSTTGGQAGGAVFRPEAVHNTIAEDSTTDLTLSITFDFATASASLRADLNFVQTEKL